MRDFLNTARDRKVIVIQFYDPLVTGLCQGKVRVIHKRIGRVTAGVCMPFTARWKYWRDIVINPQLWPQLCRKAGQNIGCTVGRLILNGNDFIVKRGVAADACL